MIALDTDDELSSGMFAPAGGAATMIEEEPAAGGLSSGALGMAPTLAASPGMMAIPANVEAPYSGANVAILAVCAVLLHAVRHDDLRPDAQHVELGWPVRDQQFDHGFVG